MGLVATLRSAMVSAIAAADDTAVSVTYNQVTLGAYDPATDTQAVTENNVTFTTFMYSLADTEVDWAAGDMIMQKMIVNRDDLGFDPQVEDHITVAGADWEIMKIKTFPGNVGYILTVRKT